MAVAVVGDKGEREGGREREKRLEITKQVGRVLILLNQATPSR